MARKLNKSLVALGSAAIVAVYGVGLVHSGETTIESSAVMTATPAAQAGAQPIPMPTPTAVEQAVAAAIASATPSPAATSAPSTVASGTATAAYVDGTYTGAGTSRFGGFEVAVSIQDGKITGVQLTKVTNKYPASRIAQLPGQVVQRQSAAVDLVSGATYSSRAFRDAVAQALTQAAINHA